MASLLSPYGQVGKWAVEDELRIGLSHFLDLCVLFTYTLLKTFQKSVLGEEHPESFFGKQV